MDLLKQFFGVFGNDGTKRICNFYGSTEMMDVTCATFSSLDDLEEKLDTSGKGKLLFYTNYILTVLNRAQISD